MTTQDIARVCHEANRAYCQSIGDNSQSSWDDAPDWQKKSAIEGVRFTLANPNVTPEQAHNEWRRKKFYDGWTFGPVKDPVKKKHPDLVDYDQLPKAQQVKDRLFIAVVQALKGA